MEQEPKRVVVVFPAPSRQTVAMALLLAVPVSMAWFFGAALAPFALAWVLAYLLDPLIDSIEAVIRSIPRRARQPLGIGPSMARTLAVIFFFIWAVVLISLLVFPVLVAGLHSLDDLAAKAGQFRPDEYQEMARRFVTKAQERLEGFPKLRDTVVRFAGDPNLMSRAGNALAGIGRFIGEQLRKLASLAGSLLATGASFLIVPLILFYLLIDFDRLRDRLHQTVPEEYKPWFQDFVGRLDRSLGGYLRAQLLICLLFGTAMTTGLWIVGVPYALLLGPFSGVANWVPYLGGLFVAIPSSILILLQHGLTSDAFWMLGGLALVFGVVQGMDGFIFQPKIMGERIGLHPLAVLMALAIGAQLGGVYGMLLAVPAAAFLKVLLTDVKRLLYA